ncbi:MAG: lipid-binding SYLF domain-containing protein [Gemmataceae bacterium]
MKRIFGIALAVCLSFAAHSAFANPPTARTLRNATDVFEATQAIPLRCIPPALLADAQGVAIIPNVIKAGFVVGGRGGRGVVFARNANGSWDGPIFVSIGGASVGFQVGVQSTDVVLVFKSRKSLDRIIAGRDKLTLGADAAVAAGPVGRQASAGTDARFESEVYSYSRSRGLFAGVALDGTAIIYDNDANREYAASPQLIPVAENLKAKIALSSGAQPAIAPLPTSPLPASPPPAITPPN